MANVFRPSKLKARDAGRASYTEAPYGMDPLPPMGSQSALAEKRRRDARRKEAEVKAAAIRAAQDDNKGEK